MNTPRPNSGIYTWPFVSPLKHGGAQAIAEPFDLIFDLINLEGTAGHSQQNLLVCRRLTARHRADMRCYVIQLINHLMVGWISPIDIPILTSWLQPWGWRCDVLESTDLRYISIICIRRLTMSWSRSQYPKKDRRRMTSDILRWTPYVIDWR